jgi:hypothetical protein
MKLGSVADEISRDSASGEQQTQIKPPQCCAVAVPIASGGRTVEVA